MQIDTANEALTIIYSPYQGDTSQVAGPLSLTGLQSGRPLNLGVLVNQDAYSVFVEGTMLKQVHDGRVTGAAGPSFYANGSAGSWRLSAVRYYSVS